MSVELINIDFSVIVTNNEISVLGNLLLSISIRKQITLEYSTMLLKNTLPCFYTFAICFLLKVSPSFTSITTRRKWKLFWIDIIW